MLYSTTRGTSGDIERETWLARQEALVNMFRYLGKAQHHDERSQRTSSEPACESEGDRLLHLDDDGLLLLVNVGGLGELDIAHSDVTGSGELDALLGAGYDDGLTKLGQIPDLRGKV